MPIQTRRSQRSEGGPRSFVVSHSNVSAGWFSFILEFPFVCLNNCIYLSVIVTLTLFSVWYLVLMVTMTPFFCFSPVYFMDNISSIRSWKVICWNVRGIN